MFPDVDNQDLARREREEGALALKVLILAPFATVGPFDVHDQDVPSRFVFLGGITILDGSLLVLGHPDSLGGLSTVRLGHDPEIGAEEMIEECRFARRLRAEDGDEMVIEAGRGDIFAGEICRDIRTAIRFW